MTTDKNLDLLFIDLYGLYDININKIIVKNIKEIEEYEKEKKEKEDKRIKEDYFFKKLCLFYFIYILFISYSYY